VREEILIEELTERTKLLVKGRTVLAIQDCFEMNLSAHKNRLKENSGIGRTDDSQGGIGFKIHPTLVVDAENLCPLGFSSLAIWHRPLEMPDRHQRGYQKLKTEEKESYKWIRASNESKKILAQAEQVIIIQDREGDFYDQLSQIPDEKHHLLIRSSSNRKLAEGMCLWDKLSEQKSVGTYKIEVSEITVRPLLNEPPL
jgi:hypothetical protein